MPRQENTPTQPMIEEDEIDLRELLSTIGRYKRSIIFLTLIITLITAVIAYRMPKYYKTSTVIEVKPKKEDQGGGLSAALGGAGALLGLAGISGGSVSTEKDAALLGMYRTHSRLLARGGYTVRYLAYERFRYIELGEHNHSVTVSDLHIPDYRNFGMKVGFMPVSDKSFKLLSVGRFFDSSLGTFLYDQPVHTEFFDLTLHKNGAGAVPERIILNGDSHYIFDQVISKNLTAEVDKKSSNPFIEISYLDTLPQRAESYIRRLIDSYIHTSIREEIEDINISLAAIDKQLQETEALVARSKQQYQSYKTKNTLLAPEAQTEVLIKEKAAIDIRISEIQHKLLLVKKLVTMSRDRRKVDTMAPALAQLGDQVTAGFIGKLQELQVEETALRQEFKSAYPKLKAVRRQIGNLRSKIRSSLQALQRILSDELTLLKKEKQTFIAQFKQGPGLETGLATRMRDYQLYEKMYTYLLQKRSAAELKKAEATNRFKTIEPIYTNPAPAKPKKALIVIVGFITALILSIFLAFFREFLRGGRER